MNTETTQQIVDACRDGGGEAAEALSRALDAQIASVEPGDAVNVDVRNLPAEFEGAGLAVVLLAGEQSAAFVLPKSSGLVPDWCDAPDATGRSKLTTLAQELGMILLPEALMPEDFAAGVVKKLSGGIARGQMADPGWLLPLELKTQSGEEASGYLVWPLARAASVLGAGSQPRAETKEAAPRPAAPESTETPGPEAGTASSSEKTEKKAPKFRLPRPASPEGLPAFTKSLLKIVVPVSVTLVRQKQSVNKILSIGPGAIIQFDKSCEDMLDLEVGELRIGTGEAVKVGEKFGLRVNEISLPKERFRGVRLSQREKTAVGAGA